jgi:hypothetical protein
MERDTFYTVSVMILVADSIFGITVESGTLGFTAVLIVTLPTAIVVGIKDLIGVIENLAFKYPIRCLLREPISATLVGASTRLLCPYLQTTLANFRVHVGDATKPTDVTSEMQETRMKLGRFPSISVTAQGGSYFLRHYPACFVACVFLFGITLPPKKRSGCQVCVKACNHLYYSDPIFCSAPMYHHVHILGSSLPV